MDRFSARPNILMVVSEDCPPRFGCYGDKLATTGHLDALAREGILFSNAFSTAPVCAPSRFSLLTGISPESNAPANHMRAAALLPEGMQTVPELLRDLGYYCTNNAKTDYNAQIDPARIWDECSKAAHWRNRPDGRPFFAVFNFDPTHESAVFRRDPFIVDPGSVRVPEYLPDTPEIREDIAQYYRVINEFDGFVGELLHQLGDDDLLEHTVIIQTSDHGGVGPRSKRFCYDDGLHVPLILRSPGRFAGLFPEAGSKVESAVSTLSIPPTVVELAGGEVPEHMQGPSLVHRRYDTARDAAFSMRDRMDERYDQTRTVRDTRYRYIRNYMPHRIYGQHQAYAWLAAGYQSWEREHLAGRLDGVRDAFWREKPAVELYDTWSDPDEVVNRAGEPKLSAVESRLQELLLKHMIEVNDNGFLAEGSPLEGYTASRSGEYQLGRVLDVADIASRRDRSQLPELVALLNDADAVIRRWAAMGTLMLGEAARPVRERVLHVAQHDPDPHVRVQAAELVARLDHGGTGLHVLGGLTGPHNDRSVRIEALNALTNLDSSTVRQLGDTIAAAADDPDQYIRGAGRYLMLKLEACYTPESVIYTGGL